MAKTPASAKTPPPPNMEYGQPYELIEVEKLQLDSQNPRLAEFALGSKPTCEPTVHR